LSGSIYRTAKARPYSNKEADIMKPEKIYSSVYQDVYRIVKGVMLVVNKFTSIRYSFKDYATRRYYDSEYLRVLEEDVNIDGIVYSAGTILYEYSPIRLADKQNWTYELKVSGGCCYGTAKDILSLTEELDKIVMTYEYGVTDAEQIKKYYNVSDDN